MRRGAALFAIIAGLLFVACADTEPQAPRPDSDSAQTYDGGRIPVDNNIYEVVGVVQSPMESLVRQTRAASGSASGVMISGTGTMSGSYHGPEFDGKGFIRIALESITPTPQQFEVPAGATIIVKSSDTKAILVGAGDRVYLRCRVQYEAVAAVLEREKFDANTVATWELDYCRLASPVVTEGEAP